MKKKSIHFIRKTRTALYKGNLLTCSLFLFFFSALAQKKPNILVLWGDDIGIANISAYSQGVMGYETPNIDRIAKEGLRLLHYYGEQSCTAGRAAFVTGQHGIRTGLTKVGFPSAPMGMSQLGYGFSDSKCLNVAGFNFKGKEK